MMKRFHYLVVGAAVLILGAVAMAAGTPAAAPPPKPQTSCPVSGEKIEGGDMGEPVSLAYKGRTIRFCCPMCPPAFKKDPAKYLAKLPGEQNGTK